ncbi:helix-turn-helix domain-containing protein, partial [Cutibacterium acnes]
MAEFLQDNLRVFVVPVDIMDIPDLDIYEQMVYIVLRSFANAREATAFPSYSTIAKLGRMSRRKAIDCVATLVAKGLLKKEVRLDVT